jgi:hypothetical protein
MKVIFAAFFLLIIGCQNKTENQDKPKNPNELMTDLINQKRKIEDSINYSFYNSNVYKQKYKSEPEGSAKEIFGDSSVFFAGEKFKFELILKDLDASIDSLSKMK